MGFTSVANSRRRFLQNATWVGMALGGLAFKVSGRDDGDPFDALPKNVWERARNNGLEMIHRPAPSTRMPKAITARAARSILLDCTVG